MTRHTPMSDERLEELRRLVGIGRGVMDLATLDCIAEIYRLRAALTEMRTTAIHYAIDTLSYAGHTEDGVTFDDCANGAAEEAAAWLVAQGELEAIGPRQWRRKERKS